MAKASLTAVLHHVRRLAEGNGAAEQDDRVLLQRFIRQRDEWAFSLLMRRHGGLVLRVCRGVLRNDQDAEDAFQATFLVLARKARTIRKGGSLASWLFGVARRTALKARQAALRRQRHQPPAPGPNPEQPSSAASLRELQALLDDEIERLPKNLHEAFVLCCIEGKNRAEAARELGWKEGTLSARVAQARERLRQKLVRRGFSLSAALAAASLITDTAVAAVPPALIQAVSRAAILFAGSQFAPGISVQVLTLSKGVLKTMFLNKVKLVTGVLLALATLTVGLGTSKFLEQTQAAQPSAENAPKDDKAVERENKDAELKRLSNAVRTTFDWGQYLKFDRIHADHAKNGAIIMTSTKCAACHNHPFTEEKRDNNRWRIVSVAQDQDKGSDYVLVVLKRQLPKKDGKEPKAPKKIPSP
ncbi:MAG TPA: sigma-70 family RNA polymerase sigma factor [Gemmataceae bacterium]|nr:sigma-70 family RNA polymerase sigma factor [Gemmataceae bacterium]